MRLDPIGYGEEERAIGAIVVKSTPGGILTLDIGPADGAPLIRVELTTSESAQLSRMLQRVVSTGEETVIFAED